MMFGKNPKEDQNIKDIAKEVKEKYGLEVEISKGRSTL